MSEVFPFPAEELTNNPFEQELVPLDQIQQSQELPDGSAVFDVGLPEPVEEKQDSDFYKNIADGVESSKLDSLAARLLEDIKNDKESRREWEKTINIMLRYMGFRVEEYRSVPFFQACAAFDSTLGTATLNSYAIERAELFPAAGPAKSEIFGIPNDEIENRGERVKMFINWYLTQKDESYYPDSERLILYKIFFGSAFRKVYQDPILNRPLARFVPPQEFIINNNTTSIQDSDRMTEVLKLNKKDVLLRQRNGDFIEFDLPKNVEANELDESEISKTIKKMDGVETDSHENKSLFTFYEVHVNMDIDEVEPKKKGMKFKDRNIPRPYVITICEATRSVVSIKRNWKEDDNTYQRIEYFVHYYYMPGFGIYSLGIAHLMGSNSIVLTSVLRQLIDAGTLKNFPGGLKMRGMRIENNDKALGPSEWHEVETGGMKLADCLMPMPYAEPSQVLMELRQQLRQESANLVGTLEKELPEMGSNTPVGTTLAMLEVTNRMPSTVLRSSHKSLGRELKLLFNLFAEHLTNEPYPFPVPGQEAVIMKQDFDDKVNIVPVSDPNVLTSTHRLLRNEALLKLAQSAPELHDMKDAYHRMYAAMNVENIDKLLPPSPPPVAVDPAAENMMVLSGKEITVKLFQDDDSHIVIHEDFANSMLTQGNTAAYSAITLHNQKHKAFKVFKELYYHQQMQQLEQQMQPQVMLLMQQGMPYEMASEQVNQMIQQQASMIQPPQVTEEEESQIINIPDIQNMVAKQDAEKLIQQQQQQQQAAEQQLDPNKVMVMDIEQRREAAHLKDEEAKLKAETEAFKAQLSFESEKNKMETQKEIASEKHEVDLAIAEQKANNPKGVI